ncbi:MAG: hypothetical protein JJE17_03745 [Peptostreptococcaceae bacterium]|nr:hypothetical protein [Peptostreptococcaceae bacterium]
MYKAYWGMEFNPFEKSLSEKNFFKSDDFALYYYYRKLDINNKDRGTGIF